MAAPETSVIIPVRNGERHLRDALSSVLAQLQPTDQVVVVDNRSEDASVAVAAEFGERVTIVSCSTLGPSAARNEGLRHATGAHIAFLDHDDLWPSNRHRLLLDALRQHPEADAACGRLLIQSDPGDARPALAVFHGRLEPELSLMPSLFRRGIIDATGYFAEDMMLGEDTEFIVRMREHNIRYTLVDTDALIYRRHATNSTTAPKSTQDGLLDALRHHVARNRERS